MPKPYDVVGVLMPDQERFRLRIPHARNASDAVDRAYPILDRYSDEYIVVAAMIPSSELYVDGGATGEVLDLPLRPKDSAATSRNDAPTVKILNNRIVRQGPFRFRRMDVAVYDAAQGGRGNLSGSRLYTVDVDVGTGHIIEGLPNDGLESPEVQAEIKAVVLDAARRR